MFTDLDKNKEMLLGSYRKIKSYYHYNKNFIFMKQKIAEMEYDYQRMLKIIDELAQILTSPHETNSNELLNAWIEKISFSLG